MNKIMFIIPSLQMGGAEKIVLTIMEELIKQNYKIYLVLLENNIFYEVNSNIKLYKLSMKSKYSNFTKLLLSPYFAYKIYKIIKKDDIKIIQSHLYRANIINAMLKFFDHNLNIQIVNHGLISRYKNMGIKGKINLFLIKYFYPKVDIIISLSKYMQYDMHLLFNFTNKQIIINNPYNIDDIIKQSLEKVNEFNFDKSKKYLISIGRLIRLKRNKDLIFALKELSNEFEVIFLGDGEERINLEKLSLDLDIKNRIHFLGNVNNPFKYLKNSFALVLTSQNEGFPNVLIEAMICKVPVISTDCKSGPREILAPDTDFKQSIKDDFEVVQYGILYPVGNIPSLIKAINYIDRKDIYDIILEAYNRVNVFSVENIVKKYIKILEG